MSDSLSRDANQVWHEWFNKQESHDPTMYAFKDMLLELPRLPLLFRGQRENTLPKKHKPCSLSKPIEVKGDKLKCCLGEDTRECPILKGLEGYVASRKKPYDIPAEEVDKLKAATCCWHILKETNMGRKHKYDTTEGYILTEEDRMYWDNVYRNLSD